jgi:hypothetical protein
MPVKTAVSMERWSLWHPTNPGVKGLERARNHNIASFVVEYGPFIQSYRQDPAER